MAFEKIVLLSGESRADYIQRRTGEGADANAILAEINGPLLFSGAQGKPWPIGVVYGAKRPAKPAPAPRRTIDPDAPIGEAHPPRVAAPTKPADDDEPAEVPPEYEGILDAEDMAEIRAEAAAQVRKEQRKTARAAALAQARTVLAAEAKLAQQRGMARGDMRDVYIDLPPFGHKHGSDIRLDGEVFEHGRTYRVTVNVARTLADQMELSWRAHKSTTGERQDFNRKRNIEVSAKHGVIGAEGLMA